MADESGVLGFDPDAVLVREPGTLLDTRFLAALRQELELELGTENAELTLLQIGLLHGLRDSARVVGRALGAPSAQAMAPTTSPLPLRFRSNPGARPAGAVELEGCWPERNEAAALLSRQGPTQRPACFLSAGYTSGWLSGIFDAEIVALETSCAARGDEACGFIAREAAAWRAQGPERVRQQLDALPFAAMREFVARHTPDPEPVPAAALASDEPCIHIWGPVMVVPFAGVDEALMAVDLIGRDPGAAHVSVVVIDLGGAIIDEAFGAAALERIVESIESAGAESIFAGLSPLSEPAVAGLAQQPLMVEKDLDAAIATAFQVADSRQRLA
jgi:hypothetical protein